MSVWTHVAAVARVDWIHHLVGKEVTFEDIFGREVPWESPEEIWLEAAEHPERFLPMGSEGSLQMNVWTNPDSCEAARYTVTIFGDLRDYDDAAGIVQWFREKLKGISFVRQAVITAETEFMETVSWTYVYGQDTEPAVIPQEGW